MANTKSAGTKTARRAAVKQKPGKRVALSDAACLREVVHLNDAILNELAKVIVGQQEVIHLLITALLGDGHCLLVGVPGLAKTLLIASLARALDVRYNRIQFTPDLMPSDITGSEIIEEKRGTKAFRFIQGPVFSNIVLADEINRTPPKTQAALLQAMQERHVTYAGNTYPLELPFFVLATQNPIEQEGTYPLPEAQLDRFMFNIQISYPDSHDEVQIIRNTACGENDPSAIQPVIQREVLTGLQHFIKNRYPVADTILEACVQLIRQTRPETSDFPFVRENVSWGAGPRAGAFLVLAAKASAALMGKETADFEDVRRVACPVLRHRLLPNYQAEAQGVTPDGIIKQLLRETCP